MPGGIVTSLEILDENQGMGNRGSKSDSLISVKEQRVDGSSVLEKYCKVYSSCQGNLVFMHYIKYVYTLVKNIQELYTKGFYYKFQRSLFSSTIEEVEKREPTSSKLAYDSSSRKELILSRKTSNSLNPYYVMGFTDGEGCFL